MRSGAETLRFYGGSIVTMDGNDPVAGEVIARGGRIAWVGRQGGAPPEFRRAKPVDLKGRLLLPAFSDAHTHYLYYARTLNDVDLHGARSIKEALDRIRRHVKSYGGATGW